MQQDAQQVQNLLGGADPAREHNHAVTTADEGLQAFLDVRHDHQFIDDGVGGFRANDAGLGDANVAAVFNPLLGVTDGGAFHGPLHGARATSGADTQGSQPQLMAHILAVLVFVMPDRVATPADHQIWLPPGLQHPGIAEDVKNVVGQVFRVVPPETGGRLRN